MKRAILQISNGILSEILTGFKTGFNGRFKVKENGLPEDAKLIRSYNRDNVIEMVIESDSFKDMEDAPIPVMDAPVVATIPENDPILWLVGQFRKETAFGNVWGFQGVFHLRNDAIKACKTDNYFVAPVEIGKELPEDIKDWSVIEYPLREIYETQGDDTPRH